MTESVAEPSQGQARPTPILVTARVTFFDCEVHTDQRSARWSPDVEEPGEGPAVDPREPELSVTARALIDPRWGSRVDRAAWEDLDWRVPGPREGAFATFDRWARDDEGPGSAPPRAIPLTITFRAVDAESVTDIRAIAEHDGARQIDPRSFAGWGVEDRPQWQGTDWTAAFPGIPYPRSASDPNDSARKPYGIALPLILPLGDRDRFALNADAIGLLTILLTTADLRRLVADVLVGRLTGLWDGTLKLQNSELGIEVLGTARLSWKTSSRRESASLRHEHELGLVYRAARNIWEPRLPPVRGWRRSPLHRALREALPGISARSLQDSWDEAQRTKAMEAVVGLALDLRLALGLLEHHDALSEETLLKRAGELVAENKDPTWDCWPLFTLGTGPIDPVSLHTLGRGLNDTMEDLAQRYLQIPGLSAPGLTRPIVHGLLAAETGAFLGQSLIEQQLWGTRSHPRLPNLTHIMLRHEREYGELPGLKALREGQAVQLRRRDSSALWGALRDCIVLGAIGAGLAGSVGGWVAGLAGFAIGFILAARYNDRALSEAGKDRSRRLAGEMQQACLDAAAEAVSWVALQRRMSESAKLGAVWPPEAWRLVGLSRKRHIASRT